MSFLSRLFGSKPKPAMEAGVTTQAPDTTFANSMVPRSKAATKLALLELRLKEEQRVEMIQKLFRDSSRSLATSLGRGQTLDLLQEKHARIWTLIVTMWGTTELQRKFKELIYVDSSGRAGFSFDVLAVLMRLYEIHTNEFGDQPSGEAVKTRRGLAGEGAGSDQRHASTKSAPPQRDRW